MRRGVLAALFVPVGAFVLYGVLAWLSALFPLNGRPQESDFAAPKILVCADEIHADFVLPMSLATERWPDVVPWKPYAIEHPEAVVWIGWGDYEFFQNVPQWGDLTFGIAVKAMLGMHQTAMVFVGRKDASTARDCVRLDLDNAGLSSLLEYIDASMQKDESGQRDVRRGDRAGEIYVMTARPYHALSTCNAWVADGLAQAGLQHAFFAPFPFSVMWPLQRNSVPTSP